MERKIGERIDFEGETLEVVEQRGCEGCYFNLTDDCFKDDDILGSCCSLRTDRKYVIFKRVDMPLDLLTKAHAEFIRFGIESEIVQEIEEYLNKTK